MAAFRTELAGEGVEGSGVLSFHLRGPRKGMRAFGEVVKITEAQGRAQAWLKI